MVLLPIVVRPGARNLLFVSLLIKSHLIVLECCRWLLILSLLLLSVLLLDLFYNIVILEILLVNFLWCFLESLFSNSESRLSYYKIWVFLFFLNYFSCDVIIYQVVASRWRVVVNFSNALTVGTWFENCVLWLFINHEFWIVTAWTRFISRHSIFILTTSLCGSKLASITPLNFVN